MPEIKLGSSKNAKNINLGSKEIEEVRLGRVLVWQNNIAPQIVLTSPEVGEYGDLDFPIGITVASNVNIVFSAQDLDPLDTIVSYAVDGPTDFTPVPTTPITPPGNPVTGLTFTIPNNLFTNPGEPTTNNVFTVTVTDQRGKEGIYTVTVVNVSVPPPTITVTKEFGSRDALTSQGEQSSTARWSITQPTVTGLAGYQMQYSFDNVNWSTGNATAITARASCGGSQTVRVYCRSVKAGSTTAIGNSAASTFSVSAPSAVFPVNLINCIGQPRIGKNTQSQSCSGVTSSGGTKELFIELRTYPAGKRYTGTGFPNLRGDDGVLNSPGYTHESIVRWYPTYTVPATSGTTLTYTCEGGDYRMTETTISYINTVNGITGVEGTTGVGSVYDRGQDFKYTTLSINSPYVSISPPSPNSYGNTSYAASFNTVGQSSIKAQYGGHYRLADGDTFQIGPGANRYDQTFQTLSNQPPFGTIISNTCNGTTQTLVIADGNGGSTTTTNPNSPECGYVAPSQPSLFFSPTGCAPGGQGFCYWSSNVKTAPGFLIYFTLISQYNTSGDFYMISSPGGTMAINNAPNRVTTLYLVRADSGPSYTSTLPGTLISSVVINDGTCTEGDLGGCGTFTLPGS